MFLINCMQHFPDISGNVQMFPSEPIQQKPIAIHIFFKAYRDLSRISIIPHTTSED